MYFFKLLLWIFPDHEHYSTSLSDTSSDLMRNFVETLKGASEAVARGNILVQDLQTILGKVDHFKSVVAEIKDLPVKANYLIATLPLRRKELDAYHSTLKIVQDFMYMCSRFDGNYICNMNAFFSFDLFMVYILECKQQLRTMK